MNELTGPAGGRGASGTDGEQIVMDTADPTSPSGLLTTHVPG